MTEQASFENSIWTPPLLPMIPAELGNTDIPAILLTDRQHNQWQFLSETIKDIPSPYSQIQDYDFSNISPSSWQPVVVPGELTMQGFDIKNNREYYYKTTISIPETFAGNRIFIRFEGVYSHCRIWVNHKYLRTHIGGFTPFDCDLTPFSDQREVTLIVGVADLEGFDEGIWNPDHKELGDSSWASFYAHHNLCGILRNATLFCLPSCFLGRIHVSSDTTGAETFLTAALSVCTPKGSIPENLSLSIQLRDQQNHICASCTEDITVQYHVESSMLPEMRMMPEVAWMQAHPKSHANDEENATRFLPTVVNEAEIFDLYSVKITLPVENPVLWDAEHPTLYTFDISLFKDNALLQRNEFGTGLRTIDYASRYGGDVNKLYINGKEIKLRGVCRHDVSYRYGRSMSAEEELREILAYKRCNINFIRTSHYPISERMLSLCDKYGIYVELENAACFQGANDFDIHCPPQDFVCSFAEMVEYARNHPSVIIWSLANESGFEESYAFRKEYRYIKEEDPERPVIFSYPDTVESTPLPYDIYSMHYQDVDGDLGRKDMPKLHDEFAHVSCYNLNDLKTDNNVRCQWGESICRGWDNIFNTDGALGCAIWSAIDDLFLLPDGVPIRHQCHSDGCAAGYGEWGAVLDIYQREKPEAFFTKKAFSPVFLNRAKSALHGNVLSLHLQNRFDHTDLKELRLHCSDVSGNVLYDDTFPVSILPHAFGTATITLPSAPDCVLITFFQENSLPELKTDCIESEWIGKKSEKTDLPPRHPMTIYLMRETPEVDIYRSPFLALRINKTTGKIALYRIGSAEELICDWEPYRKGCPNTTFCTEITHHLDGKKVYLSKNCTYEDGTIALINFIFDGASVEVDSKILPSDSSRALIEKAGISIYLSLPAESVSWERNGYYTLYPSDHIGRLSGTAHAYGQNIPYGDKPEHSWGKDTTNHFLFAKTENSCRNVTRDFQTTRDHILQYSVNLSNNWKLNVYPDDADCSALVEQTPQGDVLQITKGNYYPGLRWGNFCGTLMTEASWHTKFTLMIERTNY